MPKSLEFRIVVVGDFNLPQSKALTSFLETLLSQLVNEPTHQSGNVLDLILTSDNDCLSLISVNELNFSDHKLIKFRISSLFKTKNCEPATKILRKTDWSAFNNAVETPLCLNQHIHCPNDLANLLLEIFSAAIKQAVPS